MELLLSTRGQTDSPHGPPLRRVICVSALFAGVLFGGIGPIRLLLIARGQDAVTTTKNEVAQQFFAKHCHICHAGSEPKGDFNLKGLSLDFANKDNRDTWAAVLERSIFISEKNVWKRAFRPTTLTRNS